MGGPYKRKKYHFGDTHLKKGWRVRKRTRDLDQIQQDLRKRANNVINDAINSDVDHDLPGAGQFYCVHCAKHFVDGSAFSAHTRSKPHKRRLHHLRTPAYDIDESERAAGLGSFFKKLVGPKLETIKPKGISDKVEEMEQNENKEAQVQG